jgi:hypothetical protein
MTFWYQFRYRPLVKCSSDQQYDVVNHVTVSDVIEERAEGFHGMVAHVLKFNNKLLAQLVIDDGHRQRTGFIGQELAVVRGLQMQFEIIQGLALLKVQVIGMSEYATLEATAQSFQVTAVNVEETTSVHHDFFSRPERVLTIKT